MLQNNQASITPMIDTNDIPLITETKKQSLNSRTRKQYTTHYTSN